MTLQNTITHSIPVENPCKNQILKWKSKQEIMDYNTRDGEQP
jgi:hypothetical protein